MKCKYCSNAITELHPAWEISNKKWGMVYHHFLFCDRCWAGLEYYALANETMLEEHWDKPGTHAYLKDWFAAVAVEAGLLKE